LDPSDAAITIGPRIDPKPLRPASGDRFHSCTGDETARPTRARRKRKAYRACQGAAGRPAEAGRV